MSSLKIYQENNPKEFESYDDAQSIASELKKIGINFEQWQASNAVAKTSSQEEILDAYQNEVKEVMLKYKFKSVDVINMNSEVCKSMDQAKLEGLREKFLSEHIHTDDEVRFFIEGSGLFTIHQDSKVYSLLCEANDFINVPANTKHWFDMGAEPDFKCIRFFSDEEGWVAQYTGDQIANQFPLMEKK